MKKHLLFIPAVIAWAFSSSAFAGYAQLQPPVGWTAGTSSSAATYAKAANEAWTTNTVRTTASLNVGGRAVSVPASMRLSANAGQYITGRIGTGLLGGPAGLAVTVGLLALPTVIDWYTQQKTYRWDAATKQWYKKDDQLDCTATPATVASINKCVSDKAANGVSISISLTSSGNVCSWRMIGQQGIDIGGCVSQSGIRNEFERPAPWPEPAPALNPLPIGDPLINDPALPWPLPVQPPVINPNPAGEPQPLFVPTGNPVKNPNYNPSAPPSPANQPWLQPGVRVVPSPTPDNPWRVDVQPVDKPVENPNPSPDPKPDPAPNPGEPDPTEEREGDLCEKNPDILACQKSEDVKDTPLGEVPDFYERKYPDGIKGVWDEYSTQLGGSSLAILAAKLMPNIPGNGTCPSWHVNLDLAQWATYGNHDVAPPCYIWGIAKAILIVSALLLARALVFGG